MMGGDGGYIFYVESSSGQTVTAVLLMYEVCIKKRWKSGCWLEWSGMDARDLYS